LFRLIGGWFRLKFFKYLSEILLCISSLSDGSFKGDLRNLRVKVLEILCELILIEGAIKLYG